MLGASGEPYRITHKGITFEFGRLTRKGMNAFSVHLIDQQRDRLELLFGNDRERHDRALDRLSDDVLRGEYEFFGPRVMGSPIKVKETRVIDGEEVVGLASGMQGGILDTVPGMVDLIAILTGRSSDDVMLLYMDRQAETQHLLRLVMAESLGGKKDDWKPLPKKASKTEKPASPAGAQADPNAPGTA